MVVGANGRVVGVEEVEVTLDTIAVPFPPLLALVIVEFRTSEEVFPPPPLLLPPPVLDEPAAEEVAVITIGTLMVV